MVIATGRTKRVEQTKCYLHSWFNVFLLGQGTKQSELKLQCLNCTELIKLDYETPTHIRGVVEFNGTYIPVIDPAILLLGRPTKFNNLSCILIIPHRWNYQQFHTGILIENIDEIMELASGGLDIEPFEDISPNMRFTLDMLKSSGKEQWLYENYCLFDAHRREQQQEQDYIAFKRICSDRRKC